MRKSKFFKILTGVALSTLILAACNSEDAGKKADKDPSDVEVVFIPKMTGNAFFESGNAREERDGFILPCIRNCMAVNSDPAFFIHLNMAGCVFILPEAAAKYGSISLINYTCTDTPELGISATSNN